VLINAGYHAVDYEIEIRMRAIETRMKIACLGAVLTERMRMQMRLMNNSSSVIPSLFRLDSVSRRFIVNGNASPPAMFGLFG
jgi:hypothetical protein